mmetsp:Transcript_15039/g.34685  ORF Transcript_15039/g.34685 Transcript_15039/m.34685 type:complete len:257 (+) Transcript_15039:498-1268(+)
MLRPNAVYCKCWGFTARPFTGATALYVTMLRSETRTRPLHTRPCVWLVTFPSVIWGVFGDTFWTRYCPDSTVTTRPFPAATTLSTATLRCTSPVTSPAVLEILSSQKLHNCSMQSTPCPHPTLLLRRHTLLITTGMLAIANHTHRYIDSNVMLRSPSRPLSAAHKHAIAEPAMTNAKYLFAASNPYNNILHVLYRRNDVVRSNVTIRCHDPTVMLRVILLRVHQQDISTESLMIESLPLIASLSASGAFFKILHGS